MDLGGVEGGEGNSVGWMGEGEGGFCLVGEEKGKNMTGLIGEIGEGETCFEGEVDGDVAFLVEEEEGTRLVGEREDGLVREEEVWAGLVGDDGEGHDTGVKGVLQVKRAGGPESEGVSREKQGAAKGDVVSGGVETGKEVMGTVSAEGKGEKSKLIGAEGDTSTASVGVCEQGALEVGVASGTAGAAVLGALRRAVLVGLGSLAWDACLVGEAGPDFVGETGLAGTFLPADDGGHGTVWGCGRRWMVSWSVSLSRAVLCQNRQTDRPA